MGLDQLLFRSRQKVLSLQHKEKDEATTIHEILKPRLKKKNVSDLYIITFSFQQKDFCFLHESCGTGRSCVISAILSSVPEAQRGHMTHFCHTACEQCWIVQNRLSEELCIRRLCIKRDSFVGCQASLYKVFEAHISDQGYVREVEFRFN